MIRGIHHIALSTPDIERMLRFYRDVIGFTEVSQAAWACNPMIGRSLEAAGRVMSYQTRDYRVTDRSP